RCPPHAVSSVSPPHPPQPLLCTARRSHRSTAHFTHYYTARLQPVVGPPTQMAPLTLPTAVALAVLRPAASLASDGSRLRAPSFKQYIKLHGRDYGEPGSKEYRMRAANYVPVAEAIDSHNDDPSRTWTASVNKWSDFTQEERKELYGWQHDYSGSVGGGQVAGASALNLAARAQTKLPASFSWGHLTTMQSVKEQGSCGSCWAASAVKVLEAHYEIYKKKAKNFSVQHLVSCAENTQQCGGTGGCDGATSDVAFEYIMQHGILTEEQYPYAEKSEACPSGLLAESTRAVDLGMLGWERLPANLYAPLKHTLVELGPVVVSVAADSGVNGFGIEVYESGIYNSCNRNPVLNHAMVLYGYGQTLQVSGPVDYWQLQNSWGKSWGEGGTMRMLRKGENAAWGEEFYCGVDHDPLKGPGCPGGPASITVCGTCGILYKATYPVLQWRPPAPWQQKEAAAPEPTAAQPDKTKRKFIIKDI
ncbi:unnamed protein product, partial [Prorocentrum cordatum]